MNKFLATLRRQLRDWIDPDDDAIREQLEAREAEEPLSAEERELLNNALTFRDVTANDVAVSRSDIIAIPQTANYEDVQKTFNNTRHTRLPVTGQNLDDIRGLITLKDMLGVEPASFNLKSLLRPATFVPEGMAVGRLLALLRRNRTQMAIMVDEYGGTAGLVCLKDILAELVGELDDEHDEQTQDIIPLGKNRWQLDPKILLSELKEQLHIDLCPPDITLNELPYETIGGLILHMAGRVPEQGYQHTLANNWQLQVTASDNRRIRSIELTQNKIKTAS